MYQQPTKQQQQQEQQTIKFKNILGEEEEPICNFRSCYHTFSLHGNRSHQNEFNCVCTHPQNHAIGLSKVKLEN